MHDTWFCFLLMFRVQALHVCSLFVPLVVAPAVTCMWYTGHSSGVHIVH